MNGFLQCPKCRAPLTHAQVNQPDLAPCPGCDAPLQVEVFPALFRPVAAGTAGERLLVDNEASCFYHPQKKAVRPCEGCGRFLCALCDCELQGEHFCPACLETGKKKGKIKRLENERTLYDSIAFALAVYPIAVLFGIYFTFITAPMAVYFAFRYWNAPRSIVHRTRWRLILAAVLGSLQIAGWGIIVYLLVTRANRHG